LGKCLVKTKELYFVESGEKKENEAYFSIQYCAIAFFGGMRRSGNNSTPGRDRGQGNHRF